MRSILAALLLVLAGTAPAWPACPSYPDTTATGFVENRTAQALCLQQELGARTERAAEEARTDAMIGNIEIEVQRQRILATQHSVLPDAL